MFARKKKNGFDTAEVTEMLNSVRQKLLFAGDGFEAFLTFGMHEQTDIVDS